MDDDRYRAGLALRRLVLGDRYVDESLAKADEFSGALQRYVTENAWGAVWTRPGLDLATRSMLNLAMLAALNRPHELQLHLRGALRNGVTREQIREVLLQAAVYCGAPAAMDAFRVAREVLREADAQDPRDEPPLRRDGA